MQRIKKGLDESSRRTPLSEDEDSEGADNEGGDNPGRPAVRRRLDEAGASTTGRTAPGADPRRSRRRHLPVGTHTSDEARARAANLGHFLEHRGYGRGDQFRYRGENVRTHRDRTREAAEERAADPANTRHGYADDGFVVAEPEAAGEDDDAPLMFPAPGEGRMSPRSAYL